MNAGPPIADIAHPATYARGVPHDEFARRRRDEPVGWVTEPELVRRSTAGSTVQRGTGFWAVTTHAEVVEVSRRRDEFSSSRRGAFLVDPRTRADLERARQLLVNMDAPQHTWIRRAVSPAFTPRAVQRLAADVAEHARSTVARAMAGDDVDLVRDLAAELPLLVLADLLGLPPADRGLLLRWSNHLVGFDDPEFGGGDIEAYRQALGEAMAYAAALVRDRRRRPREDLVSALVAAEVEGRRLTDAQLCQIWLLLIVAGNETTRHLISGSLAILIGGTVDAHGPGAVEELLRLVSPILQFRRTATRDTTLAGTRIAEGDKVVLYFTSANRDERVFAEPHRFRPDRPDNPHLAFGIGPHFCLGAHLARLELAELLTAIRPYLPRLRLTGPVVRLQSNFVNGIKTMPAALVPAPRTAGRQKECP
ncbi:cytochrome P450 [Micromonospora andamanensis]|uniref:Cytochrome P450 n=1 Tax=Micromonospora andamanensis TaxID=1287068 RepID=A0ABQ4HTE9_9ACTN|nr:cytochrome P450 [Micromonospora andamanensis]GIJ08939.1 cytochrome P450 [Micromonospora andamanensis]